jgi:flagellar biosynthesis/type III secretory pathway M-ring protein FliF/YscJ
MEDIFSGVSVADMGTQATGFISAFSPYVVYLLGILLAFLVIRVIIEMVTGKKTNDLDDDIDDNYY